MEDLNKYTFDYTYDGKHIHWEFPADIDGNDLMIELKAFLKACSWSERQLIQMGFERDYEE